MTFSRQKGWSPAPEVGGGGWCTNQRACRGRRQGIALRDMYLIIGLTLREQSNVTLRSITLRDTYLIIGVSSPT